MAFKPNRKDRVAVGKPKATGAFFVAPLGTTLPTNATDELDPAFINLGYVKEEGVTHSTEESIQEYKAWGGEVIHTSANEHKEKIKLSLLQNTVDAFKFLYGAQNVEGDIESGTMTVKHSAKAPEHFSIVVELLLSDGIIERIVISDGQPSKPSEIAYNGKDLISFATEITAFPDAHQVYVYNYYAKAV